MLSEAEIHSQDDLFEERSARTSLVTCRDWGMKISRRCGGNSFEALLTAGTAGLDEDVIVAVVDTAGLGKDPVPLMFTTGSVGPVSTALAAAPSMAAVSTFASTAAASCLKLAQSQLVSMTNSKVT